VTLHYKHKQLMPGKAPAFPLHVRDFSKSQNMIPRRGTHKKELYQYSSTGYRCCQFVLYYSMCQVIIGTFSYLLMSVYFLYFQIIIHELLPPSFLSFFSRTLFQRLFSMLSASRPGAAYGA